MTGVEWWRPTAWQSLLYIYFWKLAETTSDRERPGPRLCEPCRPMVDEYNDTPAGDVTDEDWERLVPLLPSRDPQRGGRWRDHRQVVNGILWRIDNGAKWDQIPERHGPAKTRRYEATVTIASIMIRLRAKPDRGRP